MILGTWGGAWFASTRPVGRRRWRGILLGAVGGVITAGHRHLRGRPHRLRRGDQHPRPGAASTCPSRASPTCAGRRRHAVAAGRRRPRVHRPGLGLALRSSDTHWFLVSDLAGILARRCTDVSLVTVLRCCWSPLTDWLLWRTAVRAAAPLVRRDPGAAESLGVNVYATSSSRWSSPAASPGSAAAFLALVASSVYRDGQTGGRGYIGLAAMIFGNWRPGGLLIGSGCSATPTPAAARGGDAVHALLLLVAVPARRSRLWQMCARAAGRRALVVAARCSWLWFLLTDEVPGEFTSMTPYVATLLVLAFASQRLRMPAADGQVYRKGSAG